MVAPGGAWLLWGACVVAQEGMCGCLGGHAWLLWGGHVWLLQGGMHGCSGGVHGCLGGVHSCSGAWVVALGGACMVAPGGWRAWDMTTYGDTVNERAVRILLECILVQMSILNFHLRRSKNIFSL